MADVTGAIDIAKGFLPKAKSFGFGALNWGAWILVILIVAALVGFSTYFFLRWRRYKYKIVIYKKVGNQFFESGFDKAMEVKFSTAGDTIFYLQKNKTYRPTPRQQAGKNTYYYFIAEDGEWINFVPGDFDMSRREMGAHILDTEMRYARTQVQKGLRERYERQGFWKQYGTVVMSITFIALIIVGTWLLFDKWVDTAGATNSAVETAGKVLDKVDKVLANMDNICSGGSGLVPSEG